MELTCLVNSGYSGVSRGSKQWGVEVYRELVNRTECKPFTAKSHVRPIYAGWSCHDAGTKRPIAVSSTKRTCRIRILNAQKSVREETCFGVKKLMMVF
jgi:hypothetical protein